MVRLVKNCFSLELDCKKSGKTKKELLSCKPQVVSDPSFQYLNLYKMIKLLMKILGFILIIFAVADFGLSYAGYNLTYFLGEASRFSPIVIGIIGGALVNFGDKNS